METVDLGAIEVEQVRRSFGDHMKRLGKTRSFRVWFDPDEEDAEGRVMLRVEGVTPGLKISPSLIRFEWVAVNQMLGRTAGKVPA